MQIDYEKRFWSKVDVGKKQDCWNYLCGLTGDGYGVFHIKKLSHLSHRMAWYYTYGVLPNGLLRHTCDNPKCCNPNHLIEGTHLDNVRDRVDRGRSAIGEDNGRAKLSESQVLEIREKLSNGQSIASISKEYFVSDRNISHIRDKRIWKNI